MKQLFWRRIVHPATLSLLAVALLLLAGCGGDSVAVEEQIEAVSPIPSDTPTLPPPTDTPTISPTSPPSATPTATATPILPTPTPNAALGEFSYCNQQVGQSDGGRFSARLTDVRTEIFPAFERVVIDFTLAPDSAAFSAAAGCISDRDYLLATGAAVAPGAYVLELDLERWLHDDAFAASVLTPTYTFTDTTIVGESRLRFDTDADAGATLSVGLSEPVLFRMALETDADRASLLVEIARAPALVETRDLLTVARGRGEPRTEEPVFFLYDGDIWRAEGTDVISLTSSLEAETSLAVSPDGAQLAFCRNQEPGIDLAVRTFAIPNALWLMQADGSQEQLFANLGVNCAEPAFSPDGSLLALSVDESGILPTRRGIWVLPTDATGPLVSTAPLTPTDALTGTTSPDSPDQARPVAVDDEWNRTAPQWLDNDTLVYAASAPDGRDTLFLLNLTDGVEQDIGADLTLEGRYTGLGVPVVSPDGRAIAVEAQRAEEPGTDLLLLDANGVEQDVIRQGYWVRPLGWNANGELLYLTTECASTLVQHYTLYRRDNTGGDRELIQGTTLGAIGDIAWGDTSLVYITAPRAAPGPRATSNLAPYSPANLWVWNLETDVRGIIYEADRNITAVVR